MICGSKSMKNCWNMQKNKTAAIIASLKTVIQFQFPVFLAKRSAEIIGVRKICRILRVFLLTAGSKG